MLWAIVLRCVSILILLEVVLKEGQNRSGYFRRICVSILILLEVVLKESNSEKNS